MRLCGTYLQSIYPYQLSKFFIIRSARLSRIVLYAPEMRFNRCLTVVWYVCIVFMIYLSLSLNRGAR